MPKVNGFTTYHGAGDAGLLYGANQGGFRIPRSYSIKQFNYEFQNFFHPFVGTLIARLNQTSVAGMLDPDFLGGSGCNYTYPSSDYTPDNITSGNPQIAVTLDPQTIDVGIGAAPTPTITGSCFITFL